MQSAAGLQPADYGTGVPRSLGEPRIGPPFSVDLWQARPSSPAALFLGASNVVWGAIPLPVNLTPIGMPGCFLRVTPDVVLSTSTDLFGRARIAVPIPGNTAVLGGAFHNQYAVVDAGANPLGLSTTRGATGVFGNK